MKRSLSLATLCVAALFGGFAHGAPSASPYANASGIDRGGFDDKVRPQDDFFDYVNGGWIAATAIPPDRAWWGVVPELRAESEARQRAIIEEMAARSDLGPDSVARKIGAFFASLTDQSLVEGKGVAPIEDTLAHIAAIDSGESLAAAFGAAQLLGIDAPLAVGVVQDPGAADRYVPYIWQSGIALPDRDYYLRDDEKFRKIRAAYPGYIAKLLGLGGFGGTPEQGQAVFAIEQRLAELHWPAEENRDMKKLYNMVPAAQLAAVAPDFAWPQYIDAAGFGARPELMAAQLSYVKQIGAIVGEFPLEAWKDYLRYHALNSAAPWLSGEFEQANFEFMQREVLGLTELAPEWKRAVRAIDALAGEAVGQVYVERYFPAGHKQAMLGLVDDLMEAFRTGITELEWMSPAKISPRSCSSPRRTSRMQTMPSRPGRNWSAAAPGNSIYLPANIPPEPRASRRDSPSFRAKSRRIYPRRSWIGVPISPPPSAASPQPTSASSKQNDRSFPRSV